MRTEEVGTSGFTYRTRTAIPARNTTTAAAMIIFVLRLIVRLIVNTGMSRRPCGFGIRVCFHRDEEVNHGDHEAYEPGHRNMHIQKPPERVQRHHRRDRDDREAH